jgi:CRP/FNR family cyclic AMP-dependent transcriptional regulator
MEHTWMSQFPRKKVPEGEILFAEGDYSEHMYFIVQGKIAITKKVIEGADKLLAELGTGEYFGDMGLLTGARRSATARAVEASEVIVITQELFSQMLQEDPTAGLNLMKQLAKRLEHTNEELIYVALQMALSERKPLRFPREKEGKTLFVLTGSFALEQLPLVLKAHKTVMLSHRVDMITSLLRPGRSKDALLYVLETDTYKELLELLYPFGSIVEWDITVSIALDDPALDRFLK